MIKITRSYFDDCTIGRLEIDCFKCFTLELPDLNNQVNISCIPEGIYKGTYIKSPSLGECIDIMDVKGRTYIRIHAGNYTSQIKGCILVGDGIRHLNGDNIPDITNSKYTLSILLDSLPSDDFEVEIR